MAKIIVLSLFTFLSSSCSLLFPKKQYSSLADTIKMEDGDYRDQFESLGNAFENSGEVNIIKLSKKTKKYLERIHIQIIKNNELLIKTDKSIKLKVIKNNAPIVFSLPGQQIYISSGLITKYIKNESLFLAALTYEIIKSSRGIYKKNSVIPTGTVSLYKILSLASLPLKYKAELNKLSYYSLKRAGFEQSAVLNWIQLQNKNAVDFAILNSNRRIVVEEELLFKKFLSGQELEDKLTQYSSSPDFYYLLNEIKRKSR